MMLFGICLSYKRCTISCKRIPSKAFSKSMKHKNAGLLCSMYFSINCLITNAASVQGLSSLKPCCSTTSRGSVFVYNFLSSSRQQIHFSVIRRFFFIARFEKQYWIQTSFYGRKIIPFVLIKFRLSPCNCKLMSFNFSNYSFKYAMSAVSNREFFFLKTNGVPIRWATNHT